MLSLSSWLKIPASLQSAAPFSRACLNHSEGCHSRAVICSLPPLPCSLLLTAKLAHTRGPPLVTSIVLVGSLRLLGDNLLAHPVLARGATWLYFKLPSDAFPRKVHHLHPRAFIPVMVFPLPPHLPCQPTAAGKQKRQQGHLQGHPCCSPLDSAAHC